MIKKLVNSILEQVQYNHNCDKLLEHYWRTEVRVNLKQLTFI